MITTFVLVFFFYVSFIEFQFTYLFVYSTKLGSYGICHLVAWLFHLVLHGELCSTSLNSLGHAVSNGCIVAVWGGGLKRSQEQMCMAEALGKPHPLQSHRLGRMTQSTV